MTKLPAEFTKKMKTLLGEEFQEFINSYESEKVPGLRINRIKAAFGRYCERRQVFVRADSLV